MPSLTFVRAEIERMRLQVSRQKKDIRQLEEAEIGTDSALALLKRMTDRIEKLCAARDRLMAEEKQTGPTYASG